MSALHDLQQAMAAAVLTGAASETLAAIVDDAPGAAARLQIYRNHYRVTLLDVLAATFPAIQAVIGEDHFRAAGRGFILTQPPTEPCLAAYGAAFPDFLAQLAPLAAWPFLADLARLDWAVNAAFHAADAAAFDPQMLALVAESPVEQWQVRLHPSCQVVTSPFAIDQLRRSALDGDGAPFAAHEDPTALLVFRCDGEVGWVQVPAAVAPFAAALIANPSFAKATALAVAAAPAADPFVHLNALIGLGVVVAIAAPPF